MASLLEKALKVTAGVPKAREFSDDHLELAIAWAQGKVSTAKAAIVLGGKRANAPALLNGSLRQAVYQGVLVAKK